MGWLVEAIKERIIETGGPVNKREWDTWTEEEKRRWFENVKKKSSLVARQSWISNKKGSH